MNTRHFRSRLLVLLGLLALGALAGWIGHRITGTDWLYLAVPVLLALGWLKVADPMRCEADRARADAETTTRARRR